MDNGCFCLVFVLKSESKNCSFVISSQRPAADSFECMFFVLVSKCVLITVDL
jgi:hypothetical protein